MHDGGMLSEVERNVLAAVDDARIVADLRELVQIPSVDGTAAEGEIQGVVCGAAAQRSGWTVDHWQFDLPATDRGSGLSRHGGRAGATRGAVLVCCTVAVRRG